MTGRPREFDRERALETALHAFWRDGYETTSIAALTAAIGISPPSLYAAFGDKRRCFEEAVALYTGRLRAGLDAALADPSTREAVAGLLRVTAEAHTDPRTPPGCLVLTEPRLAAERARLRDTIAERINRGRHEGDVAEGVSPEQVAAFTEVVMAGMSARARDGADRATLTAVARHAADAVAAMLGSG